MINNKHAELGNSVKFLISNGCYLEIKKEHDTDMVARVYDNDEDIELDYPRFVIISREGYSGLIVYGDITKDGKAIFGCSPKFITQLYKKWVSEGRLSKTFTTTLLQKGTYSFDPEDDEVEWASLELRDWIMENVSDELFEKLKQASKDPTVSERCRDVFEEAILRITAFDSSKSEDFAFGEDIDDKDLPEEAAIGFDDYEE